MASYFNAIAFTPQERRRIDIELKKLQDLADATGLRNTSARNIVRIVLGRIGSRATKALKRRTPSGRRPVRPEGRVVMKKLVKGGIAKGKAGRLLYRSGYINKGIDKTKNRFQQILGVEHGYTTPAGRKIPPQHNISNALADAIGPNGERLTKEFAREYDKRIKELFALANARARKRGF